MSKISGPLLDRIDIHIEVPSVKYKDLSDESAGEKSEVIRERVKQQLFAQDVNAIRAGEPMRFINIKEAQKAFDDEEEWLKEHERILTKLYSYPRERLRQLLLSN